MTFGASRYFYFGPWRCSFDSQIFLSTKYCLGLVNLKPLVPGHVLILPRRIVPRLHELTEEEASELWKVATLVVGPRLEKYYQAKALTYSVQDGPEAGQTVPHAHLHVLPRKSLTDFSPFPDDIYTALQADDVTSRGIQLNTREPWRNPRTEDQMEEEATRLRTLFAESEYQQIIMIDFIPCLSAISGSFAACLALEYAFRLNGVKDPTARYFIVHAIFNTIMVYCCFPDLILVIQDPANCLNGDYSDVYTAWTIGLHLMHIVTSFEKLTAIDWAHHLVSNFLLCGLCFPFRYGPILNVSNFFLCGLPGGIDYYLLFMAKMGVITKFTEKKINRWLNMCIRLPGIVMMLCFAWVAVLSGKYHIWIGLLIFQGVLDMWNVVFFADRVVGDFYVIKEKQKASTKSDAKQQ